MDTLWFKLRIECFIPQLQSVKHMDKFMLCADDNVQVICCKSQHECKMADKCEFPDTQRTPAVTEDWLNES
jgi:hypothetical protein